MIKDSAILGQGDRPWNVAKVSHSQSVSLDRCRCCTGRGCRCITTGMVAGHGLVGHTGGGPGGEIWVCIVSAAMQKSFPPSPLLFLPGLGIPPMAGGCSPILSLVGGLC